jgi:hypothetical protein
MSKQKTIPTGALSPAYVALVGLDWADEKHALSLCAAGGSTFERATLEQTPEALADWANSLRARFPNGKIAVALEQARGALLASVRTSRTVSGQPQKPGLLSRSHAPQPLQR